MLQSLINENRGVSLTYEEYTHEEAGRKKRKGEEEEEKTERKRAEETSRSRQERAQKKPTTDEWCTIKFIHKYTHAYTCARTRRAPVSTVRYGAPRCCAVHQKEQKKVTHFVPAKGEERGKYWRHRAQKLHAPVEPADKKRARAKRRQER